MEEIEKLLEIMVRLRDPNHGCPWDREQTYSSITPYTVEEAYEVADAAARGDLAELADELGDLLFQVVFLSRLAEEEGMFTFVDVVGAICDKLVRRHPHVFGSSEDAGAESRRANWERLKREERVDVTPDASVLDGVPVALPELKRGQKFGTRAASVGFDWPNAAGVRAKVGEELAELDLAIAGRDQAGIAEELGDLLFSLASLARHHDVDAEQAAGEANRKFSRRFRGMERAARDAGQDLSNLAPAALERLWESQKSKER